MGFYKAEGIVIRTKSFGEADLIVTLFSKNYGKLHLVANGARKVKSKKRGSVQLFTYSKYLIHEGRQLDTITQGEIIESFSHLAEDLDLLMLGSYCCELIDNFLPDKEPSIELFYLLLDSLLLLPFVDREVLLRAFELKAINLNGYFPNLTICTNCGKNIGIKTFFSSSEGGVLCAECKQVDPYAISCSKGILAVMERLTKSDLKKLRVLKINQDEKDVLKKLNQNYLRYILEKNLKSWSFMKNLNINNPL